MKGCNRLMVTLVSALFIFGIFLLRESFAADNIVYVDLASVFDGYVKTKDHDDNLENIQKGKQKDIDKKVEEIKKLQDGLPLLSEKEKKKKQEEIDNKTKELQEFQRNAEMDLRKERDEKLKEILQDIQDVVEGVAKQNGYDFIINERVLLYGNSKLNISDEILKRLNDNYKKKSK